MKQKLNGLDRLLIPKLLPEKGSMLEQTTAKEILDLTKVKTEEFDEYGLVELPNGTLDWDKEKIKVEKEFDLNKIHVQALKDAVSKKDKAKEIDLLMLETCQKIQKMR